MSVTLKALVSGLVLFSAAGAFADDTDGSMDVECRDAKDKAVSKSNYRSMLVEATDTDGNILRSKRFTWADSSFAHYVGGDDHVEIEYKHGKDGFKIKENGVFSTDGYVSPHAALLVMRLQTQIDLSAARIPKFLINTTVTCDVGWNGAETVLSACYLTPVVNIPKK
jgi:hypothetical protein